MSSAAPAAVQVAAAKPIKKRAPKKPSKPSVSSLILKAAAQSSERRGVSLAAIKNALKAVGYDVDKNNARVLVAVKRLVNNKNLVQTKGSGASGSFKLNKKTPKGSKKKVVRKKKPKAKKAKKAGVKKAAGAASPAAKKKSKPKTRKAKSPKKAKKATSPKKTPKKAAKKSAKKTPRKSPKKAKRVTRPKARAAAAKK